jgi:hypothetical protein
MPNALLKSRAFEATSKAQEKLAEAPGAPPVKIYSAEALQDFVQFDGHFYKYVSGAFTYEEAVAAAEAAGGYLATVTSAEENAFLAALGTADDFSYGAWLGGSDSAVEGTWRWTEGPENGGEFTYTNWAAGEPNESNGGEDKLMMYLYDESGAGLWNDTFTLSPFSTTPNTLGYFIEIG